MHDRRQVTALAEQVMSKNCDYLLPVYYLSVALG